MTAAELTAALKAESLRLGFDLAGATAAAPTPDFERLQGWLADGCAAEMRYFTERLDAYRHPNRLLDGAKSILMLGVNYRTVDPEPGRGRVARFAWGLDYHDVVRDRLRKLADFHVRLVPTARVRTVVDTAPLLERAFGRLAGLGWIGKNTALIHPRFGSWFFLAAMLTTEELLCDELVIEDLCGACRACIDACPTGALSAPRRLDARRCLSYWTIESREPMPDAVRAVCGNRFFGCDACQEACPWNRKTPATAEPAFQPAPGTNPIDPAELAAMDEAEFRRRFRHSPLWRAGRRLGKISR